MAIEQVEPHSEPHSEPRSEPRQPTVPSAPRSPDGSRATTPTTPTRRIVGPPQWVIVALVAAYVIAFAALLFAPGGTFIERLRALDGGICAQVPSHSFFPAATQLPLCSRNTGIYLGFALTFLTLLGAGRLRASRLPGYGAIAVLAAAVLALAVDGFNSLFLDLHLPHLYQPHNLLRLATGLGTGTAMAALLIPAANSLLWRVDDKRSSFASLRVLAWMLPVLALGFLAVGSQTPWLLYPVAILSTAGLVTALSLVNLTFLLGVSNVIGYFRNWRQFFPMFTVVVVLAVIELMAMFFVKQAFLNAIGGSPLH